MEFVDVVQEALERDGTFQQLRAQLRAAVQRIVENKGGKPYNPKLISFAESDSGLIALYLVKDTLECAGLEQTLLALNAEAGEVSNQCDCNICDVRIYICSYVIIDLQHLSKMSRQSVAEDCGVNASPNDDTSLLVQLIENGGSSSNNLRTAAVSSPSSKAR